MQLTQFTDYALRTLIYIAGCKGEVCTISDIADSYNISKSHLMKIIPRLSQLGVVETLRGKKGGLRLKLTPDLINLGHLVRHVEPHFFVAECFDKKNASCVIAPACKLKHVLYEALDAFMHVLNQYTLADVIQNHDELSVLLKLN